MKCYVCGRKIINIQESFVRDTVDYRSLMRGYPSVPIFCSKKCVKLDNFKVMPILIRIGKG